MKPRTPTVTEFIQFHRIPRRTLLACAALAALQLTAAPAPAFAQSAPGDAPGARSANVDPPGRVARLDYMAGPVTTEPAGATDWSYAQVNRPLTTGDQLWNDANARSELHVGSTAVRLGAQTSVNVLNLDDSTAQLKVAQGTLSTHVRDLPAGTSYEIDTPNLALGVNGPGDYRVDVAPDGSATTVTVRSGSATVYGENGQIPVGAGQQLRFTGTDLQQIASNEAPPPDPFDQWTRARDAAENRSVSARYVSRNMTGYQDLDANGTWRDDPQYGEVWVPTATPVGWAPYHDGHWVWQAPWGWTWVDDQPWGFAPYHYGRWAHIDDSWAWVPGPLVESEPPVYAPALVGFVGGGDGGPDWSVSLAAGGIGMAGVAWFALGPGDPWHPRGGDWSPRYYERVNQTVIVNNVQNTYVNYRVPGAVTAMPATAFVHGQPVSRFAQHVDPRQWRSAHLGSGTPGIAPVAGSFSNNMRRADYRPPAALTQRQVVATRAPVAPPAFRDHLAQRFAREGGTVPGAGAPVVRVAAPPHAPFAASHGAWAPQNVRVVPPHSPVMSAAERPAGMAPQPGRPGAFAANAPAQERGQPGGAPASMMSQPSRPGGFAANAPAQERGQPGGAPASMMPQPGRPGGFAANAPAQERGQPGGAPAMAMTNPRGGPAEPAHGVPRPPQFAERPQGNMPGSPGAPGGDARRGPNAAPNAAPGATPGEAHQPIWTQPHAPMATRGQPAAGEGGRQPQFAMQQPREGAPARVPQPGFGREPQNQPPRGIEPQQRPQPQPEPPRGPQQLARPEPRQQPQPTPPEARQAQPQAQPQPRADFRAQPQPQAQPRAEFQPQPRPQPQPRAEFRPPPQPQPRPEFHPQPQPQPRAEFHPPPQPQPRPEFHPQPQPQPRAEPRPAPQPQPQAQPQPQPQPRANGGHDDHKHG